MLSITLTALIDWWRARRASSEGGHSDPASRLVLDRPRTTVRPSAIRKTTSNG